MTGPVPTSRIASTSRIVSTSRRGHPGRLIRSTVFAGVMVALAGLAHAVGGGMGPGIGVSASAVVVLAGLSFPWTARERSLPAVLPATAIAQLLLHAVFATAMRVGSADAAVTALGGEHRMAEPAATHGWAMAVAHAGAGCAEAWWLRRGERWLVRLILLSAERTRMPLCRVLARLLGAMPDGGIAHHLPAGGAAARLDADLPRALVPQRGAGGRRGPPVALVTPCKLP